MKMTVLSVLTLCAIAIAPAAMAQTPQGKNVDKKVKCERRYDRLTKSLGLSEAQVKELKEVDAKFEAVKVESRQKMQQATAERDSLVKKVLTPEQYTKMLEMRLDGRKARRAEMKAQRGERMAPLCPADSTDCPHHDKPMRRHRKK
ncbi:MAG TPA: hypothetical protein H9982_05425 [Candidatus Barnesiella excrementipullorum]|uniref:Periplasmic heavy metal sensor n=1 Tax=Candidatus Barnesiella excrementipullorum TaxID=2838479 RepID=A0A9D2AQS7_9BACT|nr:hypothetical protein [Candidatus Barnesiella excrementipullorum]